MKKKKNERQTTKMIDLTNDIHDGDRTDYEISAQQMMEIPAQQRMERLEHSEEYKSALQRAVALDVQEAYSPSRIQSSFKVG